MGMILSPINIFGLLVIMHAAYSAAHYKSLASELNIKAQGAPVDIMIEVAAGLLILLIGTLLSSPKLRPVKGGYDTLNK
jgi:hypothetical protein